MLQNQNLKVLLGPPGHTLGPGPGPARRWAFEVILDGSNLEQSRFKWNAMFEKLRSSHECKFGSARSHSIKRTRSNQVCISVFRFRVFHERSRNHKIAASVYAGHRRRKLSILMGSLGISVFHLGDVSWWVEVMFQHEFVFYFQTRLIIKWLGDGAAIINIYIYIYIYINIFSDTYSTRP